MTAPDLAVLEAAAQRLDNEHLRHTLSEWEASDISTANQPYVATIRSAIEYLRSDNNRVVEEREACEQIGEDAFKRARDAGDSDLDNVIRWAAMQECAREITAAIRVRGNRCTCFGISGPHASTHVPEGSDVEHCDLCGKPVRGERP